MTTTSTIKNNDQLDTVIGWIGFGLIIAYCFLASIFGSDFAELNIVISGLPFPIFVGEMIMLICIALSLMIVQNLRILKKKTLILISLYFGWVLLKALINFCYDGPLTFRNAALFYYPIFAVFTYFFYRRANISTKVLKALGLLALGVLFFKVMIVYYWWTYVVFILIFLWNIKSVVLRWMGWSVLLGILFLGLEYLYKGPRSHFVSVFTSVTFLLFYFGALLNKRKFFLYLSVLIVCFVLFASGYFILSDRNDITSLISLKNIVHEYQVRDKGYQAMEPSYVPKRLSVHLYNPNQAPFAVQTSNFPKESNPEPVLEPVVESTSRATPKKVSISKYSTKSVVSVSPDPSPKFSLKNQLTTMSKTIFKSRIREGRELDLNEINIIFRLFVWRDMARELIDEKAWWGFSFGKPQRSKSLETLHWAEGEWARDGWITPHNSFLHIIYRAGILGVLLFIVLFWMIGSLVRDFYRMESVEGGLLISALVYWLMLSNFFVILELPYNAIVIWTLLGVSFVFRDQLKNSNLKHKGLVVV